MEQENSTGEKVYCFGWGSGGFGLMLRGGAGADCQGTQNNGEYRPFCIAVGFHAIKIKNSNTG